MKAKKTTNNKLLLERWLGVELRAMPASETEQLVEKYAPIRGKINQPAAYDVDREYTIYKRAHACVDALRDRIISDVIIPYTSRFELKINRGNFDRDKMINHLVLIVDGVCPVCGVSESKWKTEHPPRAIGGLFEASDMLWRCENCGTSGLVPEKAILDRDQVERLD
jgi:hypothetical protein